MSASRDPFMRKILLVFAGIASVALLLAAIALLVSVSGSGTPDRPAPAPAPDGTTAAVAASHVVTPTAAPTAGRRFTLRLGQGFRFKDAAVVIGKPDNQPDITFKYLAPYVGGLATRYNPVSGNVETAMEATLTSPLPLLISTHINAFETKPDVARITSGDAATYQDRSPLFSKSRYLLLMNAAGDQYLLTLDELEAVPGKYDDWRIGFAYEQVHLPVGLAGGKINKPLPGKLIFKDWYRSKMIVRVDLTSGKEEAIADGSLPSTVGDRLLAYGDSSDAYVVRDASGKILSTMRFNERAMGPIISPDGTKVLVSVYRNGPGRKIVDVDVPGKPQLSVAVFDLNGREQCYFLGYDDATWTPDGKIIATGELFEPGLFELDPSTKGVRAIDATVASPFSPSVSPDGKTIAFVTGNKVWLIDRADGKNLHQFFLDGHNQQRPVFSPDGSKIALIICNTMAVDMTGEVFVIDRQTAEITSLRTSTGADLVPDTTTKLNWIP
jgi:hypothetical protein